MTESTLRRALWRRDGWVPKHPGLILLLALMYFVATRVGLTLAVVGGAVSLVWPPSGIALVAMLVFGRGLAPGIALGSLLANVSVGVPIPVALGIAVGATLAALMGG